MIFKLDIIKESDKAYKLNGNGWVPKSILDNRGLKRPYYQIHSWWFNLLLNKLYNKNITEQETNTLISLEQSIVNLRDMPSDNLQYWNKYWKSSYDNSPMKTNLDHYNDISAMNDLSFQDIYRT